MVRRQDATGRIPAAAALDRGRLASASTERDRVSATKLTVGIPTFNRAAWLRESIESVLAQTFTSFRLIVSDNASDDDTPEVVRSFGDERIDYVRSERNVGAIEKSQPPDRDLPRRNFSCWCPMTTSSIRAISKRPSRCWSASRPSVSRTPHST